MKYTEMHDILICAINVLHSSGYQDLAQQLDTVRLAIHRETGCPHNIPELLAHGGNIVCLACEEKCDSFVVF